MLEDQLLKDAERLSNGFHVWPNFADVVSWIFFLIGNSHIGFKCSHTLESIRLVQCVCLCDKAALTTLAATLQRSKRLSNTGNT